MFKKQKKLIDYAPKDLSLEMLCHFQRSLIAKLLVVDRELNAKFENLIAAGKEMPNASEQVEVFERALKLNKSLDKMLHFCLSMLSGKNKEKHSDN
jgi:hypothetical protein